MQKLQDISELIGAIALFFVMCMVFFAVILRYITGIIILDAFDFSRMFLGITIFWGIAAAVAWRSLITADFLYHALGPIGQRILNLVGSLLTIVVLALLSWRLWLSVKDAFGNGIRTQDIGVPLWYFYGFSAIALLVALVFSARNGYLAVTGQLEEEE